MEEGCGLGYAVKDSGLDVLAEAGGENLADAEAHQIVDAAGVAAVVSRDGDDARHIDVSINHKMTFRCVSWREVRLFDLSEEKMMFPAACEGKSCVCTSANQNSK